MPSYQFADLEEMMCKQLQFMDLSEPSSRLQPLNLAMRTPGCIGQPRSSASSLSFSSLSCLPSDSSDNVFLSSTQVGQRSEGQLASHLAKSTQRAKMSFQRSVSMVETSSPSAAALGWPRADVRLSQCDISPTALSTSPTSSTSSASTSSSSSRYKTELCRSFTESGLCKYGGKCQFAHGQDELRDLNRHPKYKTELCRTFHTIGFCPYGIRCHFVHNGEEERRHSFSRSSSSSSSSSSSIPPQPLTSRSHRPPLVRQSFSFAGFPSVPQHILQPPSPAYPAPASFTLAPSASPPPSCADISDLLSHALLEMDSAFEASPVQQYQSPVDQVASADPRSPFLPSPDSGCSPCGLSPTSSSSLRRSPSVPGVLSEPLGARSLSSTSLSDQDQDGSSSASSLSGSESSTGNNESNNRRLAVFSQLSVP